MKVTLSNKSNKVQILAHLSWYEADQLERQFVREWQRHELVPEPGDHLGDVEPSQKSDGDQVPKPRDTEENII